MFGRRREQRERRRWADWLDRHTLMTDRFMLRPPMPEDRDAYIATIDDEVRYWQGYDQDMVDQIDQSFDLLVDDSFFRERCPLSLVVETEAARVAGSYSIGIDDDPHLDDPARLRDQLTLGWWLGPEARGQGLAAPTLRAVIDYLDLHLGLPSMAMATDETNVRCRRQIEAAGGTMVSTEERTLPNGRVAQGITYRAPVWEDEDRWPPFEWTPACRRH